MTDSQPDGPETFDIHIDRKPYELDHRRFTGLELRALAGLSADLDLYLEEEGDVEDRLIDDRDVIELKPGQHFYSTPRHITPGAWTS
jgi:hypothetical protein